MKWRFILFYEKWFKRTCPHICIFCSHRKICHKDMKVGINEYLKNKKSLG